MPGTTVTELGGWVETLVWGSCKMSSLETPTSPTPGIHPNSTQDPKGIK